MTRRISPHELAAYARCPRAWWYERREPLVRLDADALSARLRTRRAMPGRGLRDDAETQVMLRLLARHERFAYGRAVHAADAARNATSVRRLGCLPAVALLCAPFLILCMLLLL
jgi:hypothetical protein